MNIISGISGYVLIFISTYIGWLIGRLFYSYITHNHVIELVKSAIEYNDIRPRETKIIIDAIGNFIPCNPHAARILGVDSIYLNNIIIFNIAPNRIININKIIVLTLWIIDLITNKSQSIIDIIALNTIISCLITFIWGTISFFKLQPINQPQHG